MDEFLHYLEGRLDGLAGTVRYDLPDSLRTELRELAQRLHEHLTEPATQA